MENLNAIQAHESDVTKFLMPEELDVCAALMDAGWTYDDAMQMIVDNREIIEDTDAPEPTKRFEINDIHSANWVLKQIARTEEQVRELNDLANAEVDKILNRVSSIIKPLEHRIKFFEGAYGCQLEDWADKTLAGSKSKSINLIHGKVGFRKSPDMVVLDVDEDVAIEECKLLGLYNCIRVKEDVNKTELKKALQQSADELANIAHIEPGQNTFYVKAELPE